MLKLFFVFFFHLSLLYASEIKINRFNSLIYLNNHNWKLKSHFNENNFQNQLKDKYYNLNFSYSNISDSFSLVLNSNYSFKENFYFYFSLIFGDNYSFSQNNFNKYRKENYKQKNYFLKGDIFGIGFKNKWFNTEISKNKECWGAGEGIQLSLSNNAKSYNYIQLSSDYGRIRVKYLHGFLESNQVNYNRYLTARGIEWTNKETFIIGLSETVIYSGEKRFLDIAYLNPISSHIEIELNNRLNNIGNANSNAVWQIHLDLLFKKRLRFSFNYLYDEFVIDRNIQKNKQDGSAYSGKISFGILENENLVFYVQKISLR